MPEIQLTPQDIARESLLEVRREFVRRGIRTRRPNERDYNVVIGQYYAIAIEALDFTLPPEHFRARYIAPAAACLVNCCEEYVVDGVLVVADIEYPPTRQNAAVAFSEVAALTVAFERRQTDCHLIIAVQRPHEPDPIRTN